MRQPIIPSEPASPVRKLARALAEVEPWHGTKRLVKFLLELYARPRSMEDRLRSLGVTVGRNVQLQPFIFDERYARLLTIEDDVSIGKGTVIYLSDGALNTVSEDPDPPPVKFGPVRICRGAVVTRDVIILCGVTIGEYAIVGAGSLVTRDVRPGMVAMGVPAREVYSVEQLKKQMYGDKTGRSNSRHFYIYMPNWRQRRRIGMTAEEQDLYYHENFPKHGF
jgi:hypothetical protein